MTLEEVLAGRLAVWGLGAEGSAMVALARARGLDPVLIDDHPERVTGASVSVAPGAHLIRPDEVV